MVDVILKFSNEIAMANRLIALGVYEKLEPLEGERRPEARWSDTNTPIETDVVSGDQYMTIRLLPDDADKLPNNDHNPAFAIVWRSDDFTYSGDVDVVTYIHHEPVWDNSDPENPVLISGGYREKVITPTYMENVNHPVPTYTVNIYDEDGNATGTRQQRIGGIV